MKEREKVVSKHQFGSTLPTQQNEKEENGGKKEKNEKKKWLGEPNTLCFARVRYIGSRRKFIS